MKYVFNVLIAFVVIWIVWSVIDHEPKKASVAVSAMAGAKDFDGARLANTCNSRLQKPVSVVFCNDENEIDIIICKTASDATRFYVILQKYCKKGPYLFMGQVTTKSALCGPLEKLLVEKTGWPIKKLRRNQNRF